VLLFPSYFQQSLHLTPMQSGLHLIPQGLGAMATQLPVSAGGRHSSGAVELQQRSAQIFK
jgi:hypothetical protein